jgi:RNA polymerase sigma factor (sigma-70 family)
MTEVNRFRQGRSDLPSADLLRECGRKVTDVALWEALQDRFHRQITTYVLRTIRIHHGKADADVASDLVQEVYLRLLEDKGRLMTSFRGETEFAVLAFLGRISMGVVTDFFRSQQAGKRMPAEIISLDQARRLENENRADDVDVTSILSWIDVSRLMESEPDRRNATRNVLIFKLHYVEGLTVREISQYRSFNLTETAIEVILKNLRTELKKRMGR